MLASNLFEPLASVQMYFSYQVSAIYMTLELEPNLISLPSVALLHHISSSTTVGFEMSLKCIAGHCYRAL